MAKLNKDQLWHETLESIKVAVSSPIFTTWFSRTHLVSLTSNNKRFLVEVGCPSLFIKNTIENRYYGLIQDSLSKTLGKTCDLTFIVKESPGKNQAPGFTPLFEQKIDEEEVFMMRLKEAKIRPQFTFANFAVSSSNQMAWAASDAVVASLGTAYNPLFFWGGVGVGKTHLMNAVGYQILKKESKKKVLFCTGEDFTNDIVEGIRNKTTPAFRNKYRRLDCLLIDDIQFIAGKDAIQEEFFHTFNALVSQGGQIILTSDRPPSEISKLEERLRSRFEAGLIVDIAPPDFELRCAITQIKARERGIDMAMDLVQLIAGNCDSARKIEGVIIKIITEMKIKKITIINEDLIKTVLGKSDTSSDLSKKVRPQDIISAVTKYYSLGKRTLLGTSRVQTVALPRQVLMYFLRTHLGLSLQEIGRLIGGRDHTTVIHAVDKITRLASENVKIREDIRGIKNLL